MESSSQKGFSAAYFAFLFSGLCFFSLPTQAESFAGSVIIHIATIAASFAMLALLVFLKNRTDSFGNVGENSLFSVFCFILCGFVFAYFTKKFSGGLSEISEQFNGALFSHFFVILSILLALYAEKSGVRSYFAVCIVTLPMLLFPFVLTFFDFLDFSFFSELEKAAVFSISFDIRLVPDAFLSCAGWSVLVFLSKANKKCKKGVAVAFFVFALAVFLEGAKYLLWFGAKNLALISRPDRVMLAQVPSINVQDLYIFSYYLSFMIKIMLFTFAGRRFIEGVSEKIPPLMTYILCGISFYGFYLFVPDKYAKVSACVCLALLYLCFLAKYLTKIIKFGKDGTNDIKKTISDSGKG